LEHSEKLGKRSGDPGAVSEMNARLVFEAADSIVRRNEVMHDPGSLFLASSVFYGGLPK
jgi:hypothetical protein